MCKLFANTFNSSWQFIVNMQEFVIRSIVDKRLTSLTETVMQCYMTVYSTLKRTMSSCA